MMHAIHLKMFLSKPIFFVTGMDCPLNRVTGQFCLFVTNEDLTRQNKYYGSIYNKGKGCRQFYDRPWN